MNPDLSKKVVDKIEDLCTLGCTRVNQILQQDAENTECEELADFTAAEKTQVLLELKNIMSVYDEKD